MIGSDDDGPRWGRSMGCAIVLTAVFTIGPLFLLRGCEAFLVTFPDTTQHVTRAVSPDGRWLVEVERDPGPDGDAQHEVYLTDQQRPDAGRRRLPDAGDMRPHASAFVTWSEDSTLMTLWLDWELSLLHDVKGRRAVPVDSIGYPMGADRAAARHALVRLGHVLEKPYPATQATSSSIQGPAAR